MQRPPHYSLQVSVKWVQVWATHDVLDDLPFTCNNLLQSVAPESHLALLLHIFVVNTHILSRQSGVLHWHAVNTRLANHYPGPKSNFYSTRTSNQAGQAMTSNWITLEVVSACGGAESQLLGACETLQHVHCHINTHATHLLEWTQIHATVKSASGNIRVKEKNSLRGK